MAAVNSTGALEFTRQRARDEADAGQAALALLPQSPYRQALMTIADMSVARDR
jgi:octaprenyl-diphosphate synthase